MQEPISITAISSISAAGSNSHATWENYLKEAHCITQKKVEKGTVLVAQVSASTKKEIDQLKNSDAKYKNLDDSVLFAMYVSRKAIQKANWQSSDNFGINIGSSRGATSLFEKHYRSFLENNIAETLSSPTTTLGNISSWVAHDLQTNGPQISHSITCSTALHALLNGVAWINSGMSEKFLVGGSEAALTDFTIAQMQALKIYAKKTQQYPCRAFDLEKKQNTMVLGEGASVLCLEKGHSENAIATIEGIGYATEILEHNISISTDADCFQKSMKMALGDLNLTAIDAIVMHAPGTVKGDVSEYKAIQKVFGETLPFLTTNKWKIGHTLGASGMLSVELAIFMLQHQQAISVPFTKEQKQPKQLKRVLVNAVGFGGNAVSVLIQK